MACTATTFCSVFTNDHDRGGRSHTRSHHDLHRHVNDQDLQLPWLKYEHLYRQEIEDLDTLAREAEHYRHVFNHTRPHEALAGHRPAEVYANPALHPQLSNQDQ